MDADGSWEVVIVGAGQAGLATSYHLAGLGIRHLVLERGRVGDAWRRRWNSFTLVTPNWTISLPGAAYRGDEPDGFMPRDRFVEHLERWARSFGCPVRTEVTVKRLSADGDGFVLDTDGGRVRAANAVVATGTYQIPRIPRIAGDLSPGILQLTPTEYECPDRLPPGGVLVVGSAQSGCQIAEELNEAGRPTFLAVGKSGRLPRRYRGRDCLYWQERMGLLDRTPDMLEHPSHRFRGDPHLSGKNGGHTISLHELRRAGVSLFGRLECVEGDRLRFADDLRRNMEASDAYAADFYRQVDDHVAATGLSAPEPTAEELAGGPASSDWTLARAATLDLAESGISTVIWATGFGFDFGWVRFPVFDEAGYPRTERGGTAQPGLYFMGLNWMHKRKSGIIFGVGEDAAHVASRIARRAATAQPPQARLAH